MKSGPKLCPKLIVFTSILVAGEENAMCLVGLRADAGSAAAARKLKWHFISTASRQTASSCPFTSNPRDTRAPFTVWSFKRPAAVIEETDSGVRGGQNSWCQHASWWRYHSKWGIHFPDISVAAVQRRRLKASNLVWSLYFTCAEIFASFILHQSQGNGSGITNFNYPPQMKCCFGSRQSWNLDNFINLLTSLALVMKVWSTTLI